MGGGAPGMSGGPAVISAAAREDLRRQLLALGFASVRFTPAETVPGTGLRRWLASGYQAEMAWMERTADKRADPALVLPGVRTVIALGVDYGAGAAPAPGRPRWARYAQHEDYHDTIKAGLAAAGKCLEALGAAPADYRYYTDTGPVLERGWAARAGVGFIGKNAMLISREHGNWLLLAAILTRLEIVPDPPAAPAAADPAENRIGRWCGKCTRCLAACPTGAFPAPGVVDARRCVSYQTIENRGVIPRELRAGIGLRIFGCDTCLEVCPWNRFAQAGRSLLLVARSELSDLTLGEVLALTPERFAAVFRRTAVKRLKLAGLLRNACVVAGNTGDAGHLPALAALAEQASPLVRAHAVWAVARLAGTGGAALLADAAARECDPLVRAEYQAEGWLP